MNKYYIARHDIYQQAKEVLHHKKKTSDAVQELVIKYPKLNPRSLAGYYIPILEYLINGRTFKGNISLDFWTYYIKKIQEEFHSTEFSNALLCLESTIQYYQDMGIQRPGYKKILQDFQQDINDLDNLNSKYIPEFDELPTTDYEGLRISVLVNKYERSIEARKKCIELKGCTCIVCGFNFENVYGDFGKNFIHIHHIVPISSIGKKYKINYATDLVPVCPNCHAMLHRKREGKNLSITELKKLISQQKH